LVCEHADEGVNVAEFGSQTCPHDIVYREQGEKEELEWEREKGKERKRERERERERKEKEKENERDGVGVSPEHAMHSMQSPEK
jgi:hypothetical protein